MAGKVTAYQKWRSASDWKMVYQTRVRLYFEFDEMMRERAYVKWCVYEIID